MHKEGPGESEEESIENGTNKNKQNKIFQYTRWLYRMEMMLLMLQLLSADACDHVSSSLWVWYIVSKMWFACGGIVFIVRVIGYWSSKATKSKAKQRKTKESKAWRKFFQNVIQIVENCNKIKVQRGSGEVLGALFASNFAVLGVLGGTWEHLAPKIRRKKKNKTWPFCLFLVRLGRRFGAHVGSKRPSWLHLGRLGLDFGSLWGDVGGIFWSFCCMCCISENVKKKKTVFMGFLMSWGWWVGYLRHVGSCFGRCWLEVELSWLVSAPSCDMLGARWRPRAPRWAKMVEHRLRDSHKETQRDATSRCVGP